MKGAHAIPPTPHSRPSPAGELPIPPHSSPTPPSSAPAGMVVGRYVVFPAIAMGGMASVHIGRMSGPVGFGRTVAIKRLHPQFANDPEFVSMFVDEARLAARVQHPNVVSVLDVVAVDGELFLVMDFVRGESLSFLLQCCRELGTPAPLDCVVSVVVGMLHGLHAAHEALDEKGCPLGIVHRDVSPQNVLVGADGVPRLVDFGVARAANRVQSTQDGQIKGKLDYLAPEQLECVPATRQTDIYAACVVLWEALSGRRLFDSEQVGAKVTRMLAGRFPAPSSFNPLVSADLDKLVAKGMARRPEDRFPTARDLALALERTLSPATPSRVGDWVLEIASDRLRDRDRTIARIESQSDSAVRRRSSLLHEVARSRAVSAAQPTLDAVPVPGDSAPSEEPPPDIEVSCVVARTSLTDLESSGAILSVEGNDRSSRRLGPMRLAALASLAAAIVIAGISLGRTIAARMPPAHPAPAASLAATAGNPSVATAATASTPVHAPSVQESVPAVSPPALASASPRAVAVAGKQHLPPREVRPAPVENVSQKTEGAGTGARPSSTARPSDDFSRLIRR